MSQGHQDKEVAARSAPKSTGDSIYMRNTTGKYCWQLLEAPQWLQLTQKETVMMILSSLPWAMPCPPCHSLVLAGWASSGNWPDWEIILQNTNDGWFSPGLKHCTIGARSMQTQISLLLSGTTRGSHTRQWMLLTASLNAVSLLSEIQPNIREQWRKCELNCQNYEFYICSKQCLIHLSHESLN